MTACALVVLALVATGCRQARSMVEFGDAAPGEKVVALTFDDGPGPHTAQVLDVLERNHLQGTFFVVGAQAVQHPDLVQREALGGHVVASHTWNHRDLSRLGAAPFSAEVDPLERWLGDRGIAVRCVRPPYGGTSRTVVERLRTRHGTYTALWDVDPQDWRGGSAQQVADHVVGHLHPGAVVVLHDGNPRSNVVGALELMLPRIRAAGYEVRPVCRPR